MKKILVLLLVALLFVAGCKKDDATPDPRLSIVGTYTGNLVIKINGTSTAYPSSCVVTADPNSSDGIISTDMMGGLKMNSIHTVTQGFVLNIPTQSYADASNPANSFNLTGNQSFSLGTAAYDCLYTTTAKSLNFSASGFYNVSGTAYPVVFTYTLTKQ